MSNKVKLDRISYFVHLIGVPISLILALYHLLPVT